MKALSSGSPGPLGPLSTIPSGLADVGDVVDKGGGRSVDDAAGPAESGMLAAVDQRLAPGAPAVRPVQRRRERAATRYQIKFRLDAGDWRRIRGTALGFRGLVANRLGPRPRGPTQRPRFGVAGAGAGTYDIPVPDTRMYLTLARTAAVGSQGSGSCTRRSTRVMSAGTTGAGHGPPPHGRRLPADAARTSRR